MSVFVVHESSDFNFLILLFFFVLFIVIVLPQLASLTIRILNYEKP